MIPSRGRVARRGVGCGYDQGFSLVELLVAMAIGLFLTAAAASLFLAARELQQEQERITTMKENLRFATDFMTRDIRGAGLRETGELDLSGGLEPGEAGSVEQASFTVRKAGVNCLGNAGPWVASVYSLHNGQLRCGNAANPPQNQPLVSNVSSMRVVALDGQGRPDWEHPVAVRIELVLQSLARGQDLSHTIEFVIGLRNAVLERHQSIGGAAP